MILSRVPSCHVTVRCLFVFRIKTPTLQGLGVGLKTTYYSSDQQNNTNDSIILQVWRGVVTGTTRRMEYGRKCATAKTKMAATRLHNSATVSHWLS